MKIISEGFERDCRRLELELMDPVERLLCTPKKELQKAAFLSKEVLDRLFERGEQEAEELAEQLGVKAREANVYTAFQTAYKKAKYSYLRKKYRLEISKPVRVDGLPGTLNLPESYQMDEVQGIMRFDYEAGRYASVFPHPVIVSERLRNIDTGEESARLQFYDNGETQSLVCRAERFSTVQKITRLRAVGIRVTSETAPELVKFLDQFVSSNVDRIPILRASRRLGWEDGSFRSFLPYDGDVAFDDEGAYRAPFLAVREQGDYSAWKALILRGCENDLTRLCMAASFASPLVPILKKLCFIVHFGGGSGIGKTVAQFAAASVWGRPEDMFNTFSATPVAIERYAGLFHSMPLFLNEGESRDTRKNRGFSQFIYQFCEGKGKPRGNVDGGVDYVPSWQSIAITNAESSIITDESKEGEINRVIDIDCGGSRPLFDDLEGAADFVKEHYGFAGREYIQKINY